MNVGITGKGGEKMAFYNVHRSLISMKLASNNTDSAVSRGARESVSAV